MLLVSIFAVVAMSCNGSDGWYYNQVSDRCIKFFAIEESRQQAASSCDANGAQLAGWKNNDSLNVFRDLVGNLMTGVYIGVFNLSGQLSNKESPRSGKFFSGDKHLLETLTNLLESLTNC